MLHDRNLLRIRNRCRRGAALIGAAVSAHIARQFGGLEVQLTARLILACLMTAVMVFMVTLIVTFINLGLRSDFLLQWAKAYIIAWPIAAATAFLVMPSARRATDAIMLRIGG